MVFSDGVNTDDLEATADPTVWIEARLTNCIRYRNKAGRRWEVWGACDWRGNCWVGARRDDGSVIETLQEAQQHIFDFQAAGGGLDCPVTPEFVGCCPFTYVELEGV